MDVIKNTRPKTLGDLIAYEGESVWTRKTGTALGGSGSARSFGFGALLGIISLGALSVAQAYAGTGNGTLTGLTVAAGTKVGKWLAVCMEPATGIFSLEDPDGVTVGTIAVAAAFSLGGLGGTIGDGATDFVAGDKFTLTVSAVAGSGKLKPWDPTATDGTQAVAGVNIRAFSAPDGQDTAFEYIENGPVILKAETIAWPAGVTDTQKATAIAQLRALGIKVDTK